MPPSNSVVTNSLHFHLSFLLLLFMVPSHMHTFLHNIVLFYLFLKFTEVELYVFFCDLFYSSYVFVFIHIHMIICRAFTLLWILPHYIKYSLLFLTVMLLMDIWVFPLFCYYTQCFYVHLHTLILIKMYRYFSRMSSQWDLLGHKIRRGSSLLGKSQHLQNSLRWPELTLPKHRRPEI